MHVCAADGLASPPPARRSTDHRAARGAGRQLPRGRRRPTSPPPSSTSPAPRRPPSSCSAPAGAAAGSELLHGSVINGVVRDAGGFDVHVIARTRPSRGSRGAAVDPPTGPPTASAAAVAPAAGRLGPRRRRPARCSRSSSPPPATTSPCRPTCCCSSPLVVAVAVVGGAVAGRRGRRRRVAAGELVLHAARCTPSPSATPRTSSPWSSSSPSPSASSVLVDRVARRSREALPGPSRGRHARPHRGILIGERRPAARLLDQLRTTFALEAVVVAARPRRTAGSSTPAPARTRRPSPFDGDAWDLTDDGSHRPRAAGRRGSHADDQRVLRTLRCRAWRWRSSHAASRPRRPTPTRLAEADAAAHRPAAGRQPRPAHPAGVDQGVGHQPPASPTSPGTPTATGVRRDHRRRGRPAQPPRRQPARHEPAADAARCSVARRRGVPRRCRGRRPRAPSITTPDRMSQSPCPRPCPPVAADPALLERAVANVVANAVPGHRRRPAVRIEAGEVGDRVHLRIIDRGPGIDPSRPRPGVPTLPAPRRPAATRPVSGLGLAVARGFIEAIGGAARPRRHPRRRPHRRHRPAQSTAHRHRGRGDP